MDETLNTETNLNYSFSSYIFNKKNIS